MGDKVGQEAHVILLHLGHELVVQCIPVLLPVLLILFLFPLLLVIVLFPLFLLTLLTRLLVLVALLSLPALLIRVVLCYRLGGDNLSDVSANHRLRAD